MSESDSFLAEVSEEVRRDKMLAALRRYGTWIGLGVVIVLGGIAFSEWRKAQTEAAAQAKGDALWQALQADEPADRVAALQQIVSETAEGTALVDMQRAAALVLADDVPAAVALLTEIAERTDISAALRDVARLKLVSLAGDALDAQVRIDIISRLAVEGHPLNALALEQRALIHLGQGRTADAIADLQAVLEAGVADQALANRVESLLTALGAESGDQVQDG